MMLGLRFALIISSGRVRVQGARVGLLERQIGMKRVMIVVCISVAGVLLLQAQRGRQFPVWETRAVTPHEVSPARYRQVESYELERLEREGWELVSVAPFVLQNEERGPDGRKQVVTQAYPAYYFKRMKPARER